MTGFASLASDLVSNLTVFCFGLLNAAARLFTDFVEVDGVSILLSNLDASVLLSSKFDDLSVTGFAAGGCGIGGDFVSTLLVGDSFD